MREAPAREKNAMLTSGVSSARVCPSSSCKALLAASPLHACLCHTLEGSRAPSKGPGPASGVMDDAAGSDEVARLFCACQSITASSQKPERT